MGKNQRKIPEAPDLKIKRNKYDYLTFMLLLLPKNIRYSFNLRKIQRIKDNNII